MKTLCSACSLLVAAVLLWSFTGSLRRRWRRRQQLAASGLSKDLLPTQQERAVHFPHDEAAVRALDLGSNTERIVELFRSGRLARGVLLSHEATEAPNGDGSVTVNLFYTYGWYDEDGAFHERRSDDPRSGLLNHRFEPKGPGVFLVAYAPRSNDHVIFYSDGGARLAVTPQVRAPTRPAVERSAADLATIEGLVRAAHEAPDDVEGLHVLADRLCELGEPRGQLMALQLARKPGQAPLPEELELIRQHSARWIPRGLDSARFERGLLVEATCTGPIDPSHVAWKALRQLHFSEWRYDARPSPFDAPLTRLREVSGLAADALPPLLPRLTKQLEALRVEDVDVGALRTLLRELKPFPALHTLELSSPRPGAPALDVLQLALSEGPAALRHVWAPAAPFTGEQVQRCLAQLPEHVVHLTFDLDNRLRRERAWVEVTARELSLHQRGAPDRGELMRARAFLASCGLHDPPISTHSRW